MEDEIDLAQYFRTVIKHWKLVVCITLVAVITAGIVSFATPPVYQATVLLKPIGDADQKQLFELAKSGETAKFVLRYMSDNLTPGERSLASIQNIFKVETGQTYISCTAGSSDAQRAAMLANAWAEAFTEYATEANLRSLPSPETMQAQINATYTLYQQAQDSYESYQRTSKLNEIGRQIEDANLLYQAVQLRESLYENPDASQSGDAANLAFMLIKLRSLSGIPEGMQISAGNAPPVTKADIDSLVRELENRTGIHGRSSVEVLNDINTLNTRLEQEKQRSNELLSSRDTAWNAYLAAVKSAETLQIQHSARIAPVRLIDDADPPQSPAPSNRWMNIAIALALGLILGVIAAFVAEYFVRNRPAAKDEDEVKTPNTKS